jgi:hypothetical protein
MAHTRYAGCELQIILKVAKMPGLFDVLTTLAQRAAIACYPNGTSSPSVTTRQITIESGEGPIRSQEDFDLVAGNSHVYVFPDARERVVTKFERIFQAMTRVPATIDLTVLDNTVTIEGLVTIPQAVMIINNGIGYGYQIAADDTLDTIATNTAALIPGGTAIDNVITIPGSHSLIARVTTPYSAAEEISRVERVFNINIVSPTPADRATILNAIDVYLKLNFRIAGSDNFYLLLFYQDTKVTDQLEHERVYKAVLQFMIQYPTTVTQNFTTITDSFVNSIAVN